MKNRRIFLLLMFLLLVTLSACRSDNDRGGEGNLLKDDNGSFWVLSDIHFMDPDLHDDGEEFKFIKGTAAGKDLDHQAASLEAFREKALKEKPTAIILTGDLTLNGEKASAEKMAKILQPLEKAKIPVLAIPGNHDINDGWARSYLGDEKQRVDQISPADFKKIFPDGYQRASSYDPSSLSYVMDISPKYRFVFLDTNEYPKEAGASAPATNGEVREDTMTWLKSVLKETRQKEQVPIVFMHHNLYKHNPLVYKGYVLSNAAEVKKVFGKFEVPLVFSGHIHAQDIMSDPSKEIKTVEIVSSSYAICDHGYGVFDLSAKELHYQRETIDVDAWAKEHGKTDPELLNHNDYLKQLFLKDGERMAYQQFMEKQIYDPQLIDPAAALVAEANYNYFTGNDSNSPEKLAKIRNSQGYQDLTEVSPFLKNYIDYIIDDTNLNDQKFSMKISGDPH